MGPLNGIKILDFSTLLPGPYATMMLADMGAEVLRISAPDRTDLVKEWPPALRNSSVNAASAWLGRNKKSIVLDLKKESGLKVISDLIENKGFDIIVEQFRPGVMKKLSLDYDTLCKINDRIIYCSLTGYGQTGPLADRAGHDINYLSLSGNMNCSGRKQEGPAPTNMQIADVASGSMNCVIGILAALNHRNSTGEGQYIDVSMLDGSFCLNSMDGACFLAGAPQPEREEQLLNGATIYDFYRTSDNRYISVGALEPKFYKNLCKALNIVPSPKGIFDSTQKELIRNIFSTQTLAHWKSVFSASDACVEPVLTFEEASKSEQLVKRNMLPTLTLPDAPGTEVMQIGFPIKFSKTPVEYNHAGCPDNWNNDEFLN